MDYYKNWFDYYFVHVFILCNCIVKLMFLNCAIYIPPFLLSYKYDDIAVSLPQASFLHFTFFVGGQLGGCHPPPPRPHPKYAHASWMVVTLVSDDLVG